MHVIKVCTGGSCRRAFGEDTLKKAEDLLNIKAGESTADGQIKLEKCGCLSRCEEAPNVFFAQHQSPLDQFLENGYIQTRCFPNKMEEKIKKLQENSY